MDFDNIVVYRKKIYNDARDFEDDIENDEIFAHYADRMRELNECEEEIGHSMADDLLCEVLDNLGFAEMVKEFNKLTKWYN